MPNLLDRPTTACSHLFDEVSETVDMVDARKADTAANLVNLYLKVDAMSSVLHDLSKAASEVRERMRNNLIPEAFEREHIKSFTTDEGHRVTVSQTVRASIKQDAHEQAYAWLRENNYGDLIKPTVNASSLAAAAREILEAGEMDMPDDVFSVHIMPSTSLTRKK